jgi:hypothetical protein
VTGLSERQKAALSARRLFIFGFLLSGNVPLEGGSLCLDFTNTLSWRGSSKRRDLLNGFSDLVLWGTHVGIVEKRYSQDLLKKASQNSDEADKVYERAILLRERLFRLFSLKVKKGLVEEEELIEFNSYFADTMCRACCVKTSDEGFVWLIKDFYKKLYLSAGTLQSRKPCDCRSN